MRKLGVGVVGVGEMGRRHAENLRRNVPEARLIAIADVSQERGARPRQNSRSSIPTTAWKRCWKIKISKQW